MILEFSSVATEDIKAWFERNESAREAYGDKKLAAAIMTKLKRSARR